jgi:chromo domain-containing protein 1
VTSTVLSEEQSEYEVDTILAEDNSGDETYYLVKWLGYPEERCTWEPADSFSTEETLRDWAAKKRSIADGKLTPFDTDAWQARVEALEAQKQERKRRRQAKRRRLGLLNAGIAPVGATPISGASKVNALSTKVNTEAGTSNKRTAPESPVPGREREQKRVSISIPSRPRPKPPPVLFGSSKSRPAPGPARAQRPHNPDSFKRFNLSTQRRYEKAKKDEPPPNTGRLEMFRPSEFPARSGANLAALGSRGLRRPEGSAAQGSPRAPTVDTQAGLPMRSTETFHNDSPTSQSPSSRAPALSNPLNPDSRTSTRKPDTQRDVPRRRPGPYAKRIHRQPDVWWNPGEAFVFLYYGPNREEIGAARLCGLNRLTLDRLVKSKRLTPQLNIWFQHLSTLADYQIQCDSVSWALPCI